MCQINSPYALCLLYVNYILIKINFKKRKVRRSFGDMMTLRHLSDPPRRQLL